MIKRNCNAQKDCTTKFGMKKKNVPYCRVRESKAMTTTLLFTWNNSTYTTYPIYSSGATTPINEVTNITTSSVKLSSPLGLTTTLLITNTTTTNDETSSVEETYQFSTINGNQTLGNVTFITSYSQPASSGTTTQLASLSSSNITTSGIYSELNGLQSIVTFDNDTGVRTLSVIPVS